MRDFFQTSFPLSGSSLPTLGQAVYVVCIIAFQFIPSVCKPVLYQLPKKRYHRNIWTWKIIISGSQSRSLCACVVVWDFLEYMFVYKTNYYMVCVCVCVCFMYLCSLQRCNTRLLLKISWGRYFAVLLTTIPACDQNSLLISSHDED